MYIFNVIILYSYAYINWFALECLACIWRALRGCRYEGRKIVDFPCLKFSHLLLRGGYVDMGRILSTKALLQRFHYYFILLRGLMSCRIA